MRVWISVSASPGKGAVDAVTTWRSAMKKYRFKIGQVVQASETSSKLPTGHLRVVRHLMPTPSGVPRYCVKREKEETECVAEQNQIEAVSR